MCHADIKEGSGVAEIKEGSGVADIKEVRRVYQTEK